MDNDSKNDNFEQIMATYAIHAAEQRLRDELASNYPRLRRRWTRRRNAVMAVLLAVVAMTATAAMPAPGYNYLRGSNATAPTLAINDINATLAAL